MKVAGSPARAASPGASRASRSAPTGRFWAVTNDDDELGTAVVFGSTDGGKTFKKADAPARRPDRAHARRRHRRPPDRPHHRQRARHAGLNFPTSFSDDGGKTWTASQGATQLADQDRQWFAHGPEDPQTQQTPVYLLYHNLGSAARRSTTCSCRPRPTAVRRSARPSRSPSPATTPTATSSAPTRAARGTIFVNQRNGTIYAEFTTRAAPTPAGVDLGGCATAAAGQPFEFNIVAGTRVWMSQSNDGGLTWRQLARG